MIYDIVTKKKHEEDISELNRTLDELSKFDITPNFTDKYKTWYVNKNGKIVNNQYHNISEPIKLPLFVKKVVIKISNDSLVNPYIATAFLYNSKELEYNDNVYQFSIGKSGEEIELTPDLENRYLYISDNNAESGYSGTNIFNYFAHLSVVDDDWYLNIVNGMEEINTDMGNVNNDMNKLKNEIEITYSEISMFKDIAVCGDSYTSGTLFTDVSTLKGEYESISWGKCLERMSGVNVTVYASGGADTGTFQTRSACLPSILKHNAHELYVLCLGINDSNYYAYKKGTIADIHDDYTLNPDTFYGNYGKIISQIIEHAPKAKIILSKVFLTPAYGNSWGEIYNYSSIAIDEIANHFDIKVIETKDSALFTSEFFKNTHVNHPTEPTYSAMGKEMKKLIEKCIDNNYSYFRDYGLTD